MKGGEFPRAERLRVKPLFLYFEHTLTALNHAFGGDYRFMLNIVGYKKELCKVEAGLENCNIRPGTSPPPLLSFLKASIY